jgi:uncharacterized protein (DUF58 family)
MLSAEIIAKIKSINLRGRHLASDVMAGEYASAFHGRGMEFHEVRDYVPGDDVRDIDWNVTARMNSPYVKVFREEREMTLMLVVDVSASMTIGSTRPRSVAAAELAAILAWLAIKSHDRIGLMLFGQKVELFLPPRKGSSHVWRIIKELYTWSYGSPGTDVSHAVDHLEKVLKRKSVCFFISDFLTEQSLSPLARLSKKHDLTCVLMDHEPLDGGTNSGGSGVVFYEDLESGEFIEFDTSNKKSRDTLQDHYQKWSSSIEAKVSGLGAGFLRITSGDSVVDLLLDYLKRQTNKSRANKARARVL